MEGNKKGRWTNIKSNEGRIQERKTDKQKEIKKKYLTLMLVACLLKRKWMSAQIFLLPKQKI